jgi:DNA-binding SARP family transcriptional activator
LAARAHTTFSRDACVETLWPNADADAAINSLNQTVFQLRRYIDPAYRGGESPDYVISTSDQVALNPELVHTDLSELRRLPMRLAGADWSQRQVAARKAISLVRGEFLADFPYEDWSTAQQIAVHTEVRELLMPIASSSPVEYAEDVGLQAAAALMTLDPWDEGALLAMVSALARSGRRIAARRLVLAYAARLKEELDEAPSGEVLAAVGNLTDQR